MRSACASFLSCSYEDVRAAQLEPLRGSFLPSLVQQPLFSPPSTRRPWAISKVFWIRTEGGSSLSQTVRELEIGSVRFATPGHGRARIGSRRRSRPPRSVKGRLFRLQRRMRPIGAGCRRPIWWHRGTSPRIRKVDGRRSEGGGDAQKVIGRCLPPTSRCRVFRAPGDKRLKSTSEGVLATVRRWAAGTEGGAKAPACDVRANFIEGVMA